MRTPKVAVLAAALCVFAPLSAQALDVPNFSKGGAVFGFEFGPGAWVVDPAFMAAQMPPTFDGYTAPQLSQWWAGSLRNSYVLSLHLGYNILGHASIELSVTATGWNATSADSGGAGFAGGVLRWHPLQLLWTILKKDPRPFGLDASLWFGWGYGIAGFHATSSSPFAMGMDGFAWQFGFDAEYFFAKNFGVSLGLRGCFPGWNQLFLNFEQRYGPMLPQTVGGAFWAPFIGVVLRSGD